MEQMLRTKVPQMKCRDGKSDSHPHAGDPLEETSAIVAPDGIAPTQVPLKEEAFIALHLPGGEGGDGATKTRTECNKGNSLKLMRTLIIHPRLDRGQVAHQKAAKELGVHETLKKER
jgi:hypothetical protein